jgi:prepilin-type N-terminal cleavage/methylation domain-containing protein
MVKSRSSGSGFTIIELLVVIVVVGILAAIVIVAYNGIQQRAYTESLKSDLVQTSSLLEQYRVLNNDSYPSALTELNDGSGTKASPGTTYEYTGAGSDSCVTASSSFAMTSYYYDSTTRTITEGTCTGHDGYSPGSTGISAIAAGGYDTCVISDGETYCWGWNYYGGLGIGNQSEEWVPVAVNTAGVLAGKEITLISHGGYNSCALASDGNIFCWGVNDDGQLGDGTTSSLDLPKAVTLSGALLGQTVTDITNSEWFACAVASGAAYCWGDNFNGQLGTNNTTPSLVPIAVNTSGVLSGKTVTAIAADAQFGDNHVCAIADGEAFCWGYNGTYGTLGNNSTVQSLVPVAVSTAGVLSGKTVTDISSGAGFTCVVADGEAFCWGNNSEGQLGNNSTSYSRVPVAVSTAGVLSGKTVTEIAAGGSHTCAIADGEAFCWGYGNEGALGNNSSSDSLVPVAVDTTGVLAGKTVTAITAGYAHNCALADQEAFCWGYGGDGELGNNGTANSLVPVAVDPLP